MSGLLQDSSCLVLTGFRRRIRGVYGNTDGERSDDDSVLSISPFVPRQSPAVPVELLEPFCEGFENRDGLCFLSSHTPENYPLCCFVV